VLRHLKKLKCSGNNIEQLPEELGKCNQLEELICSENKLVSLPRSVGNLRKLHTLLARAGVPRPSDGATGPQTTRAARRPRTTRSR